MKMYFHSDLLKDPAIGPVIQKKLEGGTAELLGQICARCGDPDISASHGVLVPSAQLRHVQFRMLRAEDLLKKALVNWATTNTNWRLEAQEFLDSLLAFP